MENRIALFQRKEIRRTFHAGEWWFVVVDVVAALTKRGVRERTDFGILTAEISKATFDVTPSQHKHLKSGRRVVSRENYLDAPESVKRLRRDVTP